jgi:hypothetical protein
MAFAGKLCPSTRLCGILLDCLELASIHLECCGSQALRAGPSYSADFVIEVDLRAVKQLFGYELEHGMVHLQSPNAARSLQTLLLSIANDGEESLTTRVP